MTWYGNLEEQVFANIGLSQYRTHLEPIEQSILKAECRALSGEKTKRFACEYKTVQHSYFTLAGDIVIRHEGRMKQNADYIYRFIQRELGAQGYIIDFREIVHILNDITSVFNSAEAHGVRVNVRLNKKLQKQLQIGA
jgi:alpha-D-ribose 1-methylphosphonate 5-triphosphate synthase subunit PhnL